MDAATGTIQGGNMRILVSLAAISLIAVLYSCCIVAGEADQQEEERLRQKFKQLQKDETDENNQ